MLSTNVEIKIRRKTSGANEASKANLKANSKSKPRIGKPRRNEVPEKGVTKEGCPCNSKKVIGKDVAPHVSGCNDLEKVNSWEKSK